MSKHKKRLKKPDLSAASVNNKIQQKPKSVFLVKRASKWVILTIISSIIGVIVEYTTGLLDSFTNPENNLSYTNRMIDKVNSKQDVILRTQQRALIYLSRNYESLSARFSEGYFVFATDKYGNTSKWSYAGKFVYSDIGVQVDVTNDSIWKITINEKEFNLNTAKHMKTTVGNNTIIGTVDFNKNMKMQKILTFGTIKVGEMGYCYYFLPLNRDITRPVFAVGVSECVD